MTTTTPKPADPELMAALKERVEVQDDYARRLEQAVRTWESLDQSPQSLLDLNDTVLVTETPGSVPWPTRPVPAEPSLAELVGVLPDAIVLLDADGSVKHWNPAAAELFGWSPAEVLGQPPPFLSATHLPEHVDILTATRRDSPIRERIVSRRHKNGHALALTVHSRVTPSGDVVMIFRSAPRPESATVADTTTEVSPRFEALGRMVAGVSHDFNNVLTAICGSAELLADRIPAHSPDREWLEVIRTAGRHATGLTQKLLRIARPTPTEPQLTNLSDVVAQLQPLVKALLPHGVRVKLQCDPNLPDTLVEATALEQVILNLATNAGQAMPRGGVLQLRTATQQFQGRHHVVLAVADSGTGMETATRIRAFDPYYSASGGTGLGLATVRDLVQRAGGFIDVDSIPGLGSVFRVFFPVAEPTTPLLDGTGLSALVAEDDPAVREVIKRVLESVGFNVNEAANADEALQSAKWSPNAIDLLVTDMVMPGLNGRKLAEKLRAMHAELPVLFVSAYPCVEETVFASGFLAKPFQPRQLLAAIGALMPRMAVV